ncbi:hypothetical protein ABID21_004359 [Pseudorhizobium tarimense]|uniref:Uncharacterized protein n=1 Tax=Pseudorhizobium tarimense TaxID=1079109 RepID=A0ABV2HCE6_9HYPH|nr:hypothetical protein [Pseudorhizobium tarimense]MCJ8521282.1 hypothetical protein [Pseudorhizobium tarimense]
MTGYTVYASSTNMDHSRPNWRAADDFSVQAPPVAALPDSSLAETEKRSAQMERCGPAGLQNSSGKDKGTKNPRMTLPGVEETPVKCRRPAGHQPGERHP